MIKIFALLVAMSVSSTSIYAQEKEKVKIDPDKNVPVETLTVGDIDKLALIFELAKANPKCTFASGCIEDMSSIWRKLRVSLQRAIAPKAETQEEAPKVEEAPKE